MKKSLDIYAVQGETDVDSKKILAAYEKEIELFIDEGGRVWTEGGQYIADAKRVESGDGIGC